MFPVHVTPAIPLCQPGSGRSVGQFTIDGNKAAPVGSFKFRDFTLYFFIRIHQHTTPDETEAFCRSPGSSVNFDLQRVMVEIETMILNFGKRYSLGCREPSKSNHGVNLEDGRRLTSRAEAYLLSRQASRRLPRQAARPTPATQTTVSHNIPSHNLASHSSQPWHRLLTAYRHHHHIASSPPHRFTTTTPSAPNVRSSLAFTPYHQ